jgi:hypothetical protein
MAVRGKILSRVGDVGTRTCQTSDIQRLRLLPLRSGTMVAPSDTLPTRNEEYGNKEYWCGPMCLFVLFVKLLIFLSNFRDQRYAQ